MESNNYYYALLAENPDSTVVAEYEPLPRTETAYQSEAELEAAFIALLKAQGYEHLLLSSEADLVANLRRQLERLNDVALTDAEWKRFFEHTLANANAGIREKTALIQEDYVQAFRRDDGTTKNLRLIDRDNIHNNRLQVIHQYVAPDGQRPNRYDVTILVNGFPLVHVELKRRGVDLREAFNQIRRYQRESFWAGSGLFEYVQIFVISNGTLTKYYSNTVRERRVREAGQAQTSKSPRSSHSFEFTSWWADAANRPIADLMDFGRTFFARHTLLSILTRYCVFTTDRELLVMRPYQIVATERVLGRIVVSGNYRTYGTLDAGGYVWHTTGSGKTLTSFKTAQLASRLPGVDKVLFVVDRKDLDYQTMKEYDKFERGAANSNTSTAVLQRQLEDPSARIIITTIQKLSVFIKKNHRHPVYQQRIVFIFDECHRSQFGQMHTAVTKHFRRYHLFGFTGTPITAANAPATGRPDLKTTVQAFGCYPHGDPRRCPPEQHQTAMHTYTIVNAISDGNVLPFRIDYVSTMREHENVADAKVWDIDRERALMAPERIQRIVTYILTHFDQKTKRNSAAYTYAALTNVSQVAAARRRASVEEKKEKIRLSGFNALLAVSSIEAAKLYYDEFARQQADLPEARRLRIATIFSYGANDDFDEEENSENTEGLSPSHRDFLERAIADYNRLFQTNYDTSSERFQNYYKDVSLRMKNREIDLLIVVNMFLTGFDATTLNTLWVDKNLRWHGLLQAFSRTNRILNSVKTFGNIVCFRNLEPAVNEALALFGNREAGGIVLLRTLDDYYHGHTDANGRPVPGYAAIVAELQERFAIDQPISGEQNQKDFIQLFGALLKARNILETFDDFAGREILTERDLQDYRSRYLDLYQTYRRQTGADKENVNDDIVFEVELIKQVEVNIDYILMLIEKYRDSHLQDKEVVVSIRRTVDASLELRNKKDLIEQFIAALTPASQVDDEWTAFVRRKRAEELDQLIREENLNAEAAYAYLDVAFRDGYLPRTGTALAQVLPSLSRFTPEGERARVYERVLERLQAFFERFRTLGGGRLQ
ncbi:MAG: type I restriction endonuclease subunit R [Saprospiraceae bacterium]|nr:type I restriction endonuclease subunit R [Saprospiraceae bacterium]MDW8230936.1 type I restriction endonuclease subunit R [Saprospiraceae bacterium]